MKKREYKPLLFTTTIRNPQRIKGLLNILIKFQDKKLTNSLCIEIMGEIIRYGLYRPMNVNNVDIPIKWGGKKIHSEGSQIGKFLLSDTEVKMLISDNPQNHKEAGFDKGWPSRFATVFDFAKELGFIYYEIDKPLRFSKLGVHLANSVKIEEESGAISYEEDLQIEQKVFCNALTKYQRANPYVKVLNDNVPLILLLEVIEKLNNDKEFNGAGISILELPLLIFWKDNNAQALYERIKLLRNTHGYKPSWEVIIDICINEIMGGSYKKFKEKSIMIEYPDEFIRKMRLTGLISLRGAGRFIDINKFEYEKVKYILKNYSSYTKYSSEFDYFNYVSVIDENLMEIEYKELTQDENDKNLLKWCKHFNLDTINKELKNLGAKKKSVDNILKYLTAPVRLEFLTALLIKSKFPTIKVVPFYPCDDEGLPTSTAHGIGDQGDIECFDNKKGILVEVTMSEGAAQTKQEVWPITRHLKKFSEKTTESSCYFIAPTLYPDTIDQIDWTFDKKGLSILPFTIDDFLTFTENRDSFFEKRE